MGEFYRNIVEKNEYLPDKCHRSLIFLGHNSNHLGHQLPGSFLLLHKPICTAWQSRMSALYCSSRRKDWLSYSDQPGTNMLIGVLSLMLPCRLLCNYNRVSKDCRRWCRIRVDLRMFQAFLVDGGRSFRQVGVHSSRKRRIKIIFNLWRRYGP